MLTEKNDELNLEILSYYQRMATALIQASPEHLETVEIELTDDEESIGISIEVTENSEDFFSPTEELMSLANDLGDLLRNNNLMFSSAVFKVYINEDNKWKYELHENT